ncbi:hypothetical protein [Mangrovicoccus sp. HB161399]|uniref:nSTAND1 domain-containing NTPase n=1 Tax=Mangrovicoccus sp. HB161399 TaxID=2720392 RepID=UPI00155758FA|nr:hypothetical protein [Mangrovicoccus sp. HB161399]
MSNIDLKSFAPAEADREAFRQSFFGSLIGQAAVLVGSLVFYFGGLAMLVALAGEPLRQLRGWLETDFGPAIGVALFYLLLAAPLVAVLLFSALPFTLRSRAEARARRQSFEDVPQPRDSSFRLFPYGPADASTYSRLDGLHEACLLWLEAASGTVLHLSGESGVGKSSLVSAFLLPKLVARGWAVLEMRPWGDAASRLSDKLQTDKALFPRKSKGNATTRELLAQAADRRVREHDRPLLVVIDQFEELLILNEEDQGSAFRHLIEDLAAHAVDGLKVLLVYRSDYETELFKLDLPAPVQGTNAFRLGRYNRGEAAAFLKAGGRLPAPDGRESLFHGLDRIEGTPGLYRQITLNMVGLFLERMGDKLNGDPGLLIQDYLESSLTEGAEHAVAARIAVLDCLITDAGTKRPRLEPDMVEATGLPPHMVRATLHGLAGKGLVRTLEAEERIWEISHDFLAALLGRAIGRKTPSVWTRLRPVLGPAAVVGWAALFALGLPFWQNWREDRAIETIRAAEGAIGKHRDGGGIEVVFNIGRLSENCSKPSPDWAAVFAALSTLNDLQGLRIRGSGGPQAPGCSTPDASRYWANLDFQRLIEIDLSGTQIASLEHMPDLPALETLYLSSTQIASLEHMPDLPALEALDLASTQIASLEHMPDLPALEALYLSSTQIASLEHMPDLPALEELDLSSTQIASLQHMPDLPALEWLNLSSTQIASLEHMPDLPALETLYLYGTQLDRDDVRFVAKRNPMAEIVVGDP